MHLLAAFSGKLQGVIGQLRVAPEANEITAALELLKIVPLEGVTITGDAIFTQREICRVIIEGGGAYFFTVNLDNQPALKADIALAFGPDSPSAEWSPPPDLRAAETIEKGHGRIEPRRLEATTGIAEHLAPAWCGVAQVCRLTHQRIVRGKNHRDGLRHHQPECRQSRCCRVARFVTRTLGHRECAAEAHGKEFTMN